jgi:hypothetical protein
MKNNPSTSQDSQERSAILVEWGKTLYAIWCMRCRKVTECYKQLENLRCCECEYKLGEELDPDYARMLRSGHEGEVH